MWRHNTFARTTLDMFIREKIHAHQSTFEVCERSSDGSIVVLREIRVFYCCTKNSRGEIRHIIYDEEMRPIEPVYRFLNETLKKLSPNTIANAITPLRLYIAFCEAYGFKDLVVPEMYCNELTEFLFRNEKTQSSTAALYSSIIRSFLRRKGHANDPYMAHVPRVTWTSGADGVERPRNYDQYKYAPKRNTEREQVCPAHNTIEDYDRIQKVMSTRSGRYGPVDYAGCIILILEFFLGRRCGEVLGLTIEDISTITDPETGEITHVLYLRNRVTDVIGHHAKTREHIVDTRYYNNADYISAYQLPRNCIKIDDGLFELMQTYIDIVHSWAQNEHPERYAKAKADIVNPEQFAKDWGLKENHYFFLNFLGGPLEKRAWHKRLVRYYHAANVPLGPGKSPNHGFRHGVAWILRHILHKNSRDIADYLGQKCTKSADIYAKASFDEIAQLGAIVQQYILGEIEKLKKPNE